MTIGIARRALHIRSNQPPASRFRFGSSAYESAKPDRRRNSAIRTKKDRTTCRRLHKPRRVNVNAKSASNARFLDQMKGPNSKAVAAAQIRVENKSRIEN